MLILGTYHTQVDHCQLKDFASVLQMGCSRQHHRCNFNFDTIKREASLGALLLRLRMYAETLQAKTQGKFAKTCALIANVNAPLMLGSPGSRESPFTTYRVRGKNVPPG